MAKNISIQMLEGKWARQGNVVGVRAGGGLVHVCECNSLGHNKSADANAIAARIVKDHNRAMLAANERKDAK